MDHLRRLAVVTALICLPGGVADAADLDLAAQARAFADCTGRMTAEMEHGWLTGAPAAVAEESREAFVTLIAAILPDLAADQALRIAVWRAEARIAQRGLLDLAAFGPDARSRQRAAALAEGYAASCARLIVGV